MFITQDPSNSASTQKPPHTNRSPTNEAQVPATANAAIIKLGSSALRKPANTCHLNQIDNSQKVTDAYLHYFFKLKNQPVLFNITGTGGMGKDTFKQRLQHMTDRKLVHINAKKFKKSPQYLANTLPQFLKQQLNWLEKNQLKMRVDDQRALQAFRIEFDKLMKEKTAGVNASTLKTIKKDIENTFAKRYPEISKIEEQLKSAFLIQQHQLEIQKYRDENPIFILDHHDQKEEVRSAIDKYATKFPGLVRSDIKFTLGPVENQQRTKAREENGGKTDNWDPTRYVNYTQTLFSEIDDLITESTPENLSNSTSSKNVLVITTASHSKLSNAPLFRACLSCIEGTIQHQDMGLLFDTFKDVIADNVNSGDVAFDDNRGLSLKGLLAILKTKAFATHTK